MKKTYQNPEIQLYAMSEEDVIATSSLVLYNKGGVSQGEDYIVW